MRHLIDYKIFEKKDFDSEEIFTNTKGGRFWGNAGAGVFVIAKSTGNVLVPLRSKHVNEPLTWGIFGGKLDGSEKPIDAAKRELEEEIKYKGKIEIIPSYIYNSPDKTFTYYNFIGLVEDEFKPTLDWETSRAVWMSYEQLLKLKKKHFGLQALLDNASAQISDIIKQQSPHTD